ncbi:hypothetical protein [Leucobacter insecticola]|nr:hypothetical protein [Leucobacter insecticola]
MAFTMQPGCRNRHPMPGRLEKLSLQAQRHLHTAERIGVLVGADQYVHT